MSSQSASPAQLGESDIALLPAHELIGLLHRGEIGSEELLDIFLARCDRFNGEVNAVVAFDREGARTAARAADRRLARGDEAPLLGLPMTIKDTFEVAGMPATCGLPMLADHVPERDADAVSRLRAAGAVIFGKTNVPIGGADHQSFNPVYGVTRNPWALDRTVGGSSGGAAAALAAGLTALELGSDIGGSIRIPAHFCGVFGHKASQGAISTRGHIPPMPGEQPVAELSVAGPMARSARDLEMALDLLYDPGTSGAARLPASRSESLAGLRIAVWAKDLPFAADARVRAAMARVAADLARAGARVSDVARPEFDPQQSHDTYIRTLFSIVLGSQRFKLDPSEREALARDAQAYGAILEECAVPDPDRWQCLTRRRHGLHAAWRRFFADWDILVCPVFPTPAFEHDLSGEGLVAQLHRRRQVDDESHVYMSQLCWPGLATVGNLPATTVPVPRQSGELPVGVQLLGPFMEDRTPLRLAQLMERELGYVATPPPMAQVPADA